MKKLKTVCRTSEVDAISDRIVLLYKQKTYTDEYLANLMASIETLSAQITTALKRSKALSDLEDMDAVRDEQTRALARIIEGYANFPAGALRTAGQKLKQIFDKYTLTIVSGSYDSQSAYTESLLEDLNIPETATLAGVPETVSALATANQAFVEARIAFQKEEAAQKQTESATDVKLPLVSAINELGSYLTTMRKVNPAVYAEFANELEKNIEDQNKLVATRKTRSEKSKE